MRLSSSSSSSEYNKKEADSKIETKLVIASEEREVGRGNIIIGN